MLKQIQKYIEPSRKIRWLETTLLIIMVAAALIAALTGISRLNSDPGKLQSIGTMQMSRDESEEDFDEDYTVCEVVYANGEDQMIISYTYDDYLKLEDDTITAYGFVAEDGTRLFFDHSDPSQSEIGQTYRQIVSAELMPRFNLANSLLILSVSLCVILLFSKCFTTYEKTWFISIMTLATIFAVLFPEESANGVNGIVIMLLYLLDTFLNILCELLISKQSRYNFLVSVLVEITEIVICIVLMYRFATMVTTLFFWLPIDIISFINWSRHRDDAEDELTVVRRLKGYQEVLVIIAIAVWTVVVGYLISGLDIRTDFITDKALETAIAYIDACASAVGIANGLFILFRLREQWLAWYVCAILEAIINIISGQYVLLILKLGYLTNTTYGYIKWSRYIRSHREEAPSLF